MTSPSLKAQMELLQQSPSSAHRANGALDNDLPTMRRRRGRRKNVEGLELLFMANKRAAAGVRMDRRGARVPLSATSRSLGVSLQDDSEDTKVSSVEDVQASLTAPEQSLSSRSAGVEEEEPAVSSKELGDWLRQHPTYTMDMAGFTPVGSRSPWSSPGRRSGLMPSPDVSSSAEERRPAPVSVLEAEAEAPSLPEPQQDRHQHSDRRGEGSCGEQTQRTQGECSPRARRAAGDLVLKNACHLQMGGAMAPPMKELPRWLLDNPEFSVAPDWTEIVKQSVSSV